jgi:hypothetical protein
LPKRGSRRRRWAVGFGAAGLAALLVAGGALSLGTRPGDAGPLPGLPPDLLEQPELGPRIASAELLPGDYQVTGFLDLVDAQIGFAYGYAVPNSPWHVRYDEEYNLGYAQYRSVKVRCSVGWGFGRLGPVGVFGAFDQPFGHFAFDDSGRGSEPAGGVEAADQHADEPAPAGLVRRAVRGGKRPAGRLSAGRSATRR